MADLRARFDELLSAVLAQHPTWRRLRNAVEVPTRHGERKQTVCYRVVDTHVELTSVVLPTAMVTSTDRGWRTLALRAWSRNDATNLVTFTFDARDRLIGLICHLAEHLDEEELELYVTVLAAECDRFEFLLSGLDAGSLDEAEGKYNEPSEARDRLSACAMPGRTSVRLTR